MELLDDKNLEKLGIIKEIDTLDIIRKANEIKDKKIKTMMVIFLTLVTVFSIIAQVIFFILFGVNTMQLIASAIYMIVLCVVLGLFGIKGGELA